MDKEDNKMNPIKSIIEYYISNIHHKGKRHVVRNILKLLPISYIRSFYGTIIKSNPCDKTNIYAISGEYGDVISNHIKSLPNNCAFIDIGANYGLYSLLAGQVLTNGRVLSFEPNPLIYNHFISAIYKNNLKNIIPFHCAIGKEDTLLNLAFNASHSGVSCLSNKIENGGFTVPVFNISYWKLLKNALAPHPDIHIKIDVEGYEQSIIEVLQQAPWFKAVRSIIIEIDNNNLKSFNSDAKALYKLLETEGFNSTIGLNEDKHYDEIFVRSTT